MPTQSSPNPSLLLSKAKRCSWLFKPFCFHKVCSVDMLVAGLKINAGFRLDSFRDTYPWEHFGLTDKIVLIICLNTWNISDTFLKNKPSTSWIPCGWETIDKWLRNFGSLVGIRNSQTWLFGDVFWGTLLHSFVPLCIRPRLERPRLGISRWEVCCGWVFQTLVNTPLWLMADAQGVVLSEERLSAL